jgi:hypothetical protein
LYTVKVKIEKLHIAYVVFVLHEHGASRLQCQNQSLYTVLYQTVHLGATWTLIPNKEYLNRTRNTSYRRRTVVIQASHYGGVGPHASLQSPQTLNTISDCWDPIDLIFYGERASQPARRKLFSQTWRKSAIGDSAEPK